MTTKQEATEREDLPTLTNGCIVDKMVGKWGPYRYRVTKHQGKQTWKYLGKTSRLVSMSDEERVGNSSDEEDGK
ncbi:MAG: hypothetical protein KGD60_15085 [Candidatus Thorarchaeota archaeon]|nr:hypothetical protein [Candidatus Thorarchaeota archaeon]